MATFIYPVDLSTPYRAVAVTQVLDALNAQFGITTSDGTSLNRLALPWVSSDPTAPTSGQVWVRSDIANGEIHTRLNGYSVTHRAVRQSVLSSAMSGSYSNTAYGDITNASVTITPTGGVLRISVVGDDATAFGWLLVGGASTSDGGLKYLVGATTVAICTIGMATATHSINGIYPLGYYTPTAGVSITVKLQCYVSFNTSSLLPTGKLLVEELG